MALKRWRLERDHPGTCTRSETKLIAVSPVVTEFVLHVSTIIVIMCADIVCDHGHFCRRPGYQR